MVNFGDVSCTKSVCMPKVAKQLLKTVFFFRCIYKKQRICVSMY